MPDQQKAVKFSVILPTYNRASLVQRAIRSVLGQTYDDFELLVVDDMSTDQTAEVVRGLRDDRIQYVRRAQNGGVAATRNTGIRLARGKYIALLDDDDEYYERFLERMHDAFETSSERVGLGWCGTRTVMDTEAGEIVLKENIWQPRFESREEAYLSFLGSRQIGTGCGIVVRAACLDVVGPFDESMRKSVDTEFFCRCVRQYDFLVVPEVLIKIHGHPHSRLSTQDGELAKSYEIIIRKNIEAVRAHRALSAKLHYKTGWLFYAAGDKKKGRRYLRRALRSSPFHPKMWMTVGLYETVGAGAAARLHRLASRVRKIFHKKPG